MSDYDLGARLRALIGILHGEQLRVDDVIDMLPRHYAGARASEHKKIRRDLAFLRELGFDIHRIGPEYMIEGFRFPEAPSDRGEKRHRPGLVEWAALRRQKRREYQSRYFKQRYREDVQFREQHLRRNRKGGQDAE